MTTVACGAAIVLVTEDGGHGRVFKGVRAYLSTSWCILHEEPDLEAAPIEGTEREGPRVRLWPHRNGTDAMFVAAFRRRG